MQTKGFTLIEMLVTLSVITVFMAVLPMLKPSEQIVLRYEMLTLKERLLQAQSEAILQKKAKHVDFHGNQYRIDEQNYTMHTAVSCDATPFHFTPQGTISNALTVYCRTSTRTKELVLQLGSGRMDER